MTTDQTTWRVLPETCECGTAVITIPTGGYGITALSSKFHVGNSVVLEAERRPTWNVHGLTKSEGCPTYATQRLDVFVEHICPGSLS